MPNSAYCLRYSLKIQDIFYEKVFEYDLGLTHVHFYPSLYPANFPWYPIQIVIFVDYGKNYDALSVKSFFFHNTLNPWLCSTLSRKLSETLLPLSATTCPAASTVAANWTSGTRAARNTHTREKKETVKNFLSLFSLGCENDQFSSPAQDEPLEPERWFAPGLPEFSWHNILQRGKIYQIAT
jgi:hypothetical protein